MLQVREKSFIHCEFYICILNCAQCCWWTMTWWQRLILWMKLPIFLEIQFRLLPQDGNLTLFHHLTKEPKKGWLVECSEKYKSFKLKIPQPDSERRHSPDFRTVFGIMIGPFSFCEIGKTWGTNKQTKIENFNFHNQIWSEVRVMNKVFFLIHFVLKSFFF